jgi:hypothetical protein
MIDPRFFTLLGPVAVADLAKGRSVRGDPGRLVSGVAALSDAGPGDLA